MLKLYLLGTILILGKAAQASDSKSLEEPNDIRRQIEMSQYEALRSVAKTHGDEERVKQLEASLPEDEKRRQDQRDQFKALFSGAQSYESIEEMIKLRKSALDHGFNILAEGFEEKIAAFRKN